ncbi:hypothetical protein Mgra_00003201 [Meloidogyne graminicola]|uniref:Uncharacterized protein n=1 Tax=Meloidogyne graminicola TaxID=189291 RepID=A0A8S9ZW55_9BILA|nr:hypothetical protein Mgra_00003201 [Meloidogyne graminicola]
MREPYDLEWCRKKRFPETNITHLLTERELGMRREGSNFLKGSREFYQSISLCRGEHAVDRVHFFPLRFTPDGSKLIAIAQNFHEIYIFPYFGVQFGANCTRNELFNSIFRKRIVVQLINPLGNPRSPENLYFGILSRECAFITPDSRFLIVSSSFPIPESRSTFNRILRNQESLPPDSHLMNIVFYSIDLEKGQLVDKYKFDFDEINIQSGVYLLEWTLGILSVQHQTIHIFRIDKNSGAFVALKQIGPSVLDDDQLWDYQVNFENELIEQFFTAFRQRFLAFLFKQHSTNGTINQFLYEMDFYTQLKMQKIQFVGPELILIRMDLHPRNNDAHSGHQYMFVLLEWRLGQIEGIFDKSSSLLFNAFEKFSEGFKNGHLAYNYFPNSMDYCEAPRRQYEAIIEDQLRLQGEEQTRQRCLAILPLPNTQHLISSPYLDPNLFNIDERILFQIEKGRFQLDQPLKIYNLKTKNCHLKLEFHSDCGRAYPAFYARVLFHPIDPFVMSVCRGIQSDFISFYMPKRPTKFI